VRSLAWGASCFQSAHPVTFPSILLNFNDIFFVVKVTQHVSAQPVMRASTVAPTPTYVINTQAKDVRQPQVLTVHNINQFASNDKVQQVRKNLLFIYSYLFNVAESACGDLSPLLQWTASLPCHLIHIAKGTGCYFRGFQPSIVLML